MTPPTPSVQLIVFGARNQNDLPGVLQDVAQAGFPAFEAWNLFQTLGEDATRRLLDETHLQLSGAHFGYGDYADAAKLDAHIAFATALGVKNLMCSGVADNSVEGYRKSAQVFDAAGKKLADAGLTFNYHNHDWEFKPLEGGVRGMDILTQETDPAHVKLNIDVFWLYYAGVDGVAFIRQHADRAGYFHFKDGRRATSAEGKTVPEFLELGRGDVDLKACYAAAQEVGATWIVAEQDSSKLPAPEAVAISRAYLRTLGI